MSEGYGGFDCHVHVVDPVRHPFPAATPRRPDASGHATLDDLDAVLATAGLGGALIVQPSPYLEDNAALLDALSRSGGRHRAIAALSLEADEATLDGMAAAGVVGVRLNLVNFDFNAALATALPPVLERLAARRWWVELQMRAPEFPKVAPLLEDSGVDVLFDHVGYPDVTKGTDEPGFAAICAFAAKGRAAIKLSGAFRLSSRPFPHEDLDAFAAAVIDAFGIERCVWGSDYPFLWVDQRPAFSEALAQLARWVPDPEHRAIVLRDAPMRLFGFTAAAPA